MAALKIYNYIKKGPQQFHVTLSILCSTAAATVFRRLVLLLVSTLCPFLQRSSKA